MLTSSVWRGRVSQPRALSAFAGGCLLGGLSTASVIWLLSGLWGGVARAPWRDALLVSVAVAALLRDCGRISFTLPASHRVVPQSVFEKGPYRAALQFGFELGTGVRTQVTTTLPYVSVVAISLFAQHPAAAWFSGLCFGFGRASTALLRYWSSETDPWDEELNRYATLLVRGSAVIGLVGVLLLAIGDLLAK